MSVVKTCTWASILKGSGMGLLLFSIRLEAGFLHHTGPHLDIGFEASVQFFRRPGHRLAAELDHALLEIAVGDDGADVAVEEGDDVPRCTCGRHQRVPAVDCGIDAAFAQCRYMGCCGERWLPEEAMARTLPASIADLSAA